MKKSGIKNRGFASLTPEKRRELQSKGGKAAWKKGTAHRFTSDEARKAAKKSWLKRAHDE